MWPLTHTWVVRLLLTAARLLLWLALAYLKDDLREESLGIVEERCREALQHGPASFREELVHHLRDAQSVANDELNGIPLAESNLLLRIPKPTNRQLLITLITVTTTVIKVRITLAYRRARR